MLIGEKSTFAIECEVRDVFGSFVYCNFRFWVAGEPIGNWDEEAVLGTLMHSAKVFLLHHGDRYLGHADSMNTETLWGHINRFANSDDQNDLRIGLEGRYRSRFLLHEIADDSVATVCEVVVVERADGVQRLLWKSRGSNDIQEVAVPKRTVDQVIADFLHWGETMTPTDK